MSRIENTRMLEEFVEKSGRGARPVPLKRTSYDVSVVSGMAVVRQKRVFRNDEAKPIEALLTFPVAFESVVTSLECEVGGRRLKGRAVAKKEARDTYEKAIDNGKTAVLHEELLRGLHMVSVANVGAGTEISVEATYVAPLSIVGDVGLLRIPLTIGDIFGALPLPDSDQVLKGGPKAMADVTLSTASGRVLLNGRPAVDGKASVGLDDVMEVRVEGLVLSPVRGRAADGRDVSLWFAAPAAAAAVLDVDLMIDVSGSMMEAVSLAAEGPASKYEVVMRALHDVAAAGDRNGDQFSVWQFNNSCRLVGRCGRSGLSALLSEVQRPGMTTDLKGAVETVVASRPEAHVLLITDGKAGRKIDVQDIVARGARVTVVLIGSDSLEVNVGYLAAQSGGEMFVVHGQDAGAAIHAAMSSMRLNGLPSAPVKGVPQKVVRRVAGTEVTAEWGKADGVEVAQVPALAAFLAMSGMQEEAAASLAESEGIVSHLTSIVMVDEEGVTQTDLPEQRKVALPDSAVRGLSMMAMAADVPSDGAQLSALRSFAAVRPAQPVGAFGSARGVSGSPKWDLASELGFSGPSRGGVVQERGITGGFFDDQAFDRDPNLFLEVRTTTTLGILAGADSVFASFDWNAHLASVSASPVGPLPASVMILILRAAALPEFVGRARETGVDAQALAVAVFARLFSPKNRVAQRVSRKLLSGISEAVILELENAVRSRT